MPRNSQRSSLLASNLVFLVAGMNACTALFATSWDARRWLVVDSLTSPTYPSFESCWWCGLSQRSSPTTSCASQHQFITNRLSRRLFSLRWDGWFLTTLGVGRSLSSVDNIGCLHRRLYDNRFGGIRLEIGEQATSLAPPMLNYVRSWDIEETMAKKNVTRVLT